MNKILGVLVIVAMMAPANAAVYHFFDGEKLAEAALEWEKSQTHPKDSDLLLVTEFAGYVGAMFDYLAVKQHICSPDEITKNEVLAVISKYLKNRTKGLNDSGSQLVAEALIKKYSCNKL